MQPHTEFPVNFVPVYKYILYIISDKESNNILHSDTYLQWHAFNINSLFLTFIHSNKQSVTLYSDHALRESMVEWESEYPLITKKHRVQSAFWRANVSRLEK